jgi:hypothetical protein
VEFEDIDGLERSESDGSLDFLGHSAARKNGVGSGSVDEGSDAEFLVIVDTFERSGRGREFLGPEGGCGAGSNGASKHGAATFVQEFTTSDFFGHANLLKSSAFLLNHLSNKPNR